TRMFVFPVIRLALIRSAGFKAATASSRVETLPMFVRSRPSRTLDDLTQLGAIGLDNEVDRQAVGGPRLGRPDDGHQCSSGSNQAGGPLLDVAADDIELQIDAADVFQRVVVEVDELLRGRANLKRADFTGADLSGADLSDADLRSAYLNRTVLSGTNLAEAVLHETVLVDLN